MVNNMSMIKFEFYNTFLYEVYFNSECMWKKRFTELIKQPTIIIKDDQICTVRYLVNGKDHRLGGPTCIHFRTNGQIRYVAYRLNNLLHRLDGPSTIKYYKNGQVEYKEYWLGNKPHRRDGPAEVCYRKNGQIRYSRYWVNGKLIYPKKCIKN